MLKHITSKPYISFWVLSLFMTIYGFYFQNDTLDINVHDTYYVISWFHIFLLMSLLFLGIGLTYFTIHKLNKTKNLILTYIHIIGTIGGLLLFTLVPYIFSSESKWSYNDNLIITQLILLSLVMLVQPILFIHLMISIFKKK